MTDRIATITTKPWTFADAKRMAHSFQTPIHYSFQKTCAEVERLLTILGEKKMEKKVSIGRVVMYTRYGSPGGEHLPEPSPAIVTKVLDETAQRCQLFVMNPNGLYFNDTPYSAEPKPGHWSWPVY